MEEPLFTLEEELRALEEELRVAERTVPSPRVEPDVDGPLYRSDWVRREERVEVREPEVRLPPRTLPPAEPAVP